MIPFLRFCRTIAFCDSATLMRRPVAAGCVNPGLAKTTGLHDSLARLEYVNPVYSEGYKKLHFSFLSLSPTGTQVAYIIAKQGSELQRCSKLKNLKEAVFLTSE